MTTYLVQYNMTGTPLGLWGSSTNSFYPDYAVPEIKLAKSHMLRMRDSENWEDFTERTTGRISQRDWWDTHDSEHTDLVKVWQEIDPSSAPMFD